MADDGRRGRILSVVSETREEGSWLPDLLSDFSPWTAACVILGAHVVELRQAEVIDDGTFRQIARSLAVATTDSSGIGLVDAMVFASVEQHVDGNLPGPIRGVATLGLAREEWGATLERMAWRHGALGVGFALRGLMPELLDLAKVHAVTVMPVYAGGRLAQPSTLAHYLSGIIEPLRDHRARLRESFPRLNRCPLGAGMLAGNALDADRDALATRLGFQGPVPTTFEAVAGVEDAVEIVNLAAGAVAIVQRFLQELLIWHRTDPTSFLVDERWLSRPEPSTPSLEIPSRLDDLIATLGRLECSLDAMRQELRNAGYGPIANRRMARIQAALAFEQQVTTAIDEATSFFREGLIVNRAYLGNRAGRGMVTGGDLAYFLMAEEGIAPTAALEITSLVLARLRDSNLEVSGITQDMIDSAALLTIGQEIKVEMETLGRYLAPRRYLERRQGAGSAAPAMTRAWLDIAEAAHRDEVAWLDETIRGIDARAQNLTDLLNDAGNESPDD